MQDSPWEFGFFITWESGDRFWFFKSCLLELQPGISSISVWISYMAGHLQEGFKNPILNLCIWCKEHVPLEIGRLCVYEKGAEARQKARFSPSAPLGSPQSLPRLYFMGRQTPWKEFRSPPCGEGNVNQELLCTLQVGKPIFLLKMINQPGIAAATHMFKQPEESTEL